MNKACEYALLLSLGLFAVCLFACLYRAVKGPSTADRLISVNMSGTIVIMLILLLAVYLKQDYLTDIAIIYALLSFLAVVLLSRIFVSLNRRRGGEGDKNA